MRIAHLGLLAALLLAAPLATRAGENERLPPGMTEEAVRKARITLRKRAAAWWRYPPARPSARPSSPSG
jgi:hypothetical protein